MASGKDYFPLSGQMLGTCPESLNDASNNFPIHFHSSTHSDFDNVLGVEI